MRKFIYTLAGLTALALFASCTREAESLSSPDGTVRVVFNVSLPETVPTKAISDGLTATELKFFAYDVNNNHLDLDQTVTVTSRTATVTADLVKGIKYQFVFWAQKPGQYTTGIDADNKTLTVTPAAMMNSDNWDAFYAYDNLDGQVVSAAFTKAITLKRPFAQINVGAPVTLDSDNNRTGGDFFSASKSGLLIEGTLTSGYTMKAYTTMNLLTGEVSGTEETAITMTKVPHPDEFLKVNDTKYDYAAMAYVLAGTDAETVDLELNLYTTQNGADVNLTRSVPNVPIRRNYRTNILGNVFTVTGNFNITVDQNFGDVDAYNDDYFPQYISIEALNAAFAAGKGIGYTVEVAPSAAVSGAQIIVLPNTEDEVSIFFRGDFTNADITFEYSSVAEALKPAKLVIEAPDIDNDEDTPSIKSLSGELASTTVILNGTTVVSNASFHTASNTLHITKDARIINELTVYAGSLLVEGFIETAVIDPQVAVNTVDAVATVAEDGEVVRFIVQNLNAVIESGAKVGTLEVSTTADYDGAAPTVTIDGDVEEVVASTETGATVAPTVTITDDATVESVQQQGDAQVVISEDATVETVEAEDITKITGDGAEDVNYLIKNETQLTAAVEAKVANMKMGADFTIARGYTIDFQTDIDLGKYTISVDATNTSDFPNSRAFKFAGSDAMTIKIHNGEIKLLDDKIYGPFRMENGNGAYILDSLTLNNKMAYGLGIKVVNAKSVALSNTTLNSEIGGGVEQGINCDMTVTNCVFNQTELDTDHPWISTALAVSYNGKLDIEDGEYSAYTAIFLYSSGGTINITGGTFEGRDAVVNVENNTWEPGYAASSVVNISGGSFTGSLKVSGWGAAGTSPVSALNISGGSFSAETGKLFYETKPGTISISGGTFSEDPSAYLAEGYVALKEGDVYNVVPGILVKHNGTADTSMNNTTNGTNLKNAVEAAADGATIYLSEGIYWLPGNDYRFPQNKSFTIIGIGNVQIFSNGYGFSTNCTVEGTEVTLKNLTITNGPGKPNPVYIKDYMKLNLYDVILHNYSSTSIYAIVLDSANPINNAYDEDKNTTLNAYGVTIDDGLKVGLMAMPRQYYIDQGYSAEISTKCTFNYDSACVNIDGNVEPQNGEQCSTGSNLFVNGFALPASGN